MNVQVSDFDICVGVITAVSGVKGHVRLRSFAESPNDFSDFKRVFDREGRDYKIQLVSARGNRVIAAIDGVFSRTEAELLCNTQLFIKRSELPNTSPDQFYHADLYGVIAKLRSGEQVGIVKNIYNFGAGDILEICDFTTERMSYYPLLKSMVVEVNIDEKYLILEQIDEVVE